MEASLDVSSDGLVPLSNSSKNSGTTYQPIEEASTAIEAPSVQQQDDSSDGRVNVTIRNDVHDVENNFCDHASVSDAHSKHDSLSIADPSQIKVLEGDNNTTKDDCSVNDENDDNLDGFELLRMLPRYSYVPASDSKFDQYYLQVDPAQGDRAVDIPLYSNRRPHMRAFHLAWTSFLVAFFSWFAITPLLNEIRNSLNLTHDEIWISSSIAVMSSAITRCVIGPLNDTYGARWVMCGTLVASAIPTALSGWLIQGAVSLYITRFWIGIAGSSFVTCQYWTSSMFTTEIAGTANALAAGWGNLGGGLAQIVMGSILFPLVKLAYSGDCSANCNDGHTHENSEYDRSADLSWRTIMVFPAILSLAMAYVCVRYGDDTPKGNVSELRRCKQQQEQEGQNNNPHPADSISISQRDPSPRNSQKDHSFEASKDQCTDIQVKSVQNRHFEEREGKVINQQATSHVAVCHDELHPETPNSQSSRNPRRTAAFESCNTLGLNSSGSLNPQHVDDGDQLVKDERSWKSLPYDQSLESVNADPLVVDTDISQNISLARRDLLKPAVTAPSPLFKSIPASFKQGASNFNTWLLFAQYGCCFGVEIIMTQAAPIYFQEEFGMSTASAAAVASLFGWMNLFARGAGGFLSDIANSRAGLRGRLWCQVILLVLEGVFVLIFAFATTLGGAIAAMTIFSIFVQATEGSTFGIVPYVDSSVTGSVTGIIGAGGNVGGAVFALGIMFCDYRPGFGWMGCAVALSSLLSAFIRIPGYRGLLTGQDAEVVALHRMQAKVPAVIIFETQGEQPDTQSFHCESVSSSSVGIDMEELTSIDDHFKAS